MHETGKNLERKIVFLLDIFHLSPSVLQEQLAGGGVAEAVPELSSLELSIPGDTSQAGKLLLPQPAHTECTDFRLARRDRHILKLQGDPWQQHRRIHL